jgi:hypothetical protein
VSPPPNSGLGAGVPRRFGHCRRGAAALISLLPHTATTAEPVEIGGVVLYCPENLVASE